MRDRLSGRHRLTFGALLLPFALFLALRLWVSFNISEWAAAEVQHPLPFLIRFGLRIDNWAMRLTPYALIVFMVFSPLLTLAVMALAGCFGSSPARVSREAVIRWWLGSVAFIAAMAAPLAHTYATTKLAYPPLLPLTLGWAAFLCYSLSLGSAFELQRFRARKRMSRYSPGWVLAAAAPLHYVLFSLPALAVPLTVWIASRREEHTRIEPLGAAS